MQPYLILPHADSITGYNKVNTNEHFIIMYTCKSFLYIKRQFNFMSKIMSFEIRQA